MDRRPALEHAFEAREQIEFAKRIRDGLSLNSSPALIASTASTPLSSDSRYLTLPERRRLTNAMWKDNPIGFYLSLALAIPLNQVPANVNIEEQHDESIESILTHSHRREQMLHGKWTYLKQNDQRDELQKSEPCVALALALSTWGTLRTDQESSPSDTFPLAVAAMRANSTLTKRETPTPPFIEPSKLYARPRKVNFPKINKQTQSIKDLHQNAAIKLICEYMDSEILKMENVAPSTLQRSRKTDGEKYAHLATNAAKMAARRVTAKHLASPSYFNTTLNMHGANFPDTAATGELFYRATTGNLPILVPTAHETRREWLQRPERSAFTESPQRDILDALVTQYDLKPFLDQCRIYFHCWLRALIEDRLQYREQPHVYMSYMDTPQELLYQAPRYWPGPYQNESNRDALLRVNMTTLIPQCIFHAGRRCRLKNAPQKHKQANR